MSTLRVEVKPEVLRWARLRARKDVDALKSLFPKLEAWESGTLQPTFKQLQHYAHSVHVPLGYMFLDQPPIEALPIQDFRTLKSKAVRGFSPDLLDAIYKSQSRQHWYADFQREQGMAPLAFVGSASTDDAPEKVAASICQTLGFVVGSRKTSGVWTGALRDLITKSESAGILVMVDRWVGNQNQRRFDVAEFRGFALVDSHAPLVFINGEDSKTAQLFTLAHELAHIWLGVSALSDVGTVRDSGIPPEELWCNQVAAEMLMPSALVFEQLKKQKLAELSRHDQIEKLRKAFRVSSQVVVRRLYDLQQIDETTYHRLRTSEQKRFKQYQAAQKAKESKKDGPVIINSIAQLPRRASRRFVETLVTAALEGRTPYSDAFQLLGVKTLEQLHAIGRVLSGRK